VTFKTNDVFKLVKHIIYEKWKLWKTLPTCQDCWTRILMTDFINDKDSEKVVSTVKVNDADYGENNYSDESVGYILGGIQHLSA